MGFATSASAFATQTVRQDPGGIDSAQFRRVLGHFASGITVVTVAHGGNYHGSTVASFSSLSLDPPLVLICLNRRATTHGLIKQAGHFAVNILGEEGEALSRHFASRDPAKFAGVAHHTGRTGAPLLDAAIATLECRLVDQYPGGDHSIFVGEVLTTNTCENARPLVHYRSGYHRLD